jgi:hypothetical protein
MTATRIPPRPGSSGEYRLASRPVSSPSIIVARPATVSAYLAALNRAEGLMEEETRGWCADCDEAPDGDLCHTHQTTLDDAALIGKLRDAIAGVSESEMASWLAGSGEAA